jgi:hypothetical protein
LKFLDRYIIFLFFLFPLGFHTCDWFLWLRDRFTNPHPRTGFLSVRLSSLADRSRRSAGQEHHLETVGTPTGDAFGSWVYGENEAS